MRRKFVVDEENINAAQALIQVMGGPDKVEPEFVAIAKAEPGDVVDVPPRIWEHSS